VSVDSGTTGEAPKLFSRHSGAGVRLRECQCRFDSVEVWGMRRFLAGVVVGALLTAGIASAASESVRILVNGREIASDVPPQIINGRTMVPLRFVAEAMGAIVSWDAPSRTVRVEITPIGGGQQKIGPTYLWIEASDEARLGMVTSSPFYDGVILDNGSSIAVVSSRDLADLESRKATIESVSSRTRLYLLAGTLAKPSPPSTQEPTSLTPPLSNRSSSELLLIGADGRYLGKLTLNKFDPESIFNEFGDYGSKFSPTSIWNEFGDYGSKFSPKSAFNEFATDPPLIVADGKVIGRLSTNKLIPGAVSPYELHVFLSQRESYPALNQSVTSQPARDTEVQKIVCNEARRSWESLKNDMTARGMLTSEMARQVFEAEMNSALSALGCSP